MTLRNSNRRIKTREAVFAFDVFAQRFLDMKQDLFVYFIDFHKAFNRI